MSHRYYATSHLVLVFCGSDGDDGIYRFWLKKDAGWEFCPPDSRCWDWYHQQVYRGREIEEIDGLPNGVPPLPDQFPPPVEIHVVDEERETTTTRAGSGIHDAVHRAGGSLTVFVLLTEDRYESLFGDGIFRDFETAFFDRAEAEAAARAIDPGFGTELGVGPDKPRAHLREVVLTLVADEVHIDESRSERTVFDHYDRADICDALAGRLPH